LAGCVEVPFTSGSVDGTRTLEEPVSTGTVSLPDLHEEIDQTSTEVIPDLADVDSVENIIQYVNSEGSSGTESLTKIISGGMRPEDDVRDKLKKQNLDKSSQDGHGELEVSEIGACDEDNADVTEKELPPLAEGRISTTPYPSDTERNAR
jgi:hypothetical protein